MIDVQFFRDYGNRLKNAIAAINYCEIVVDDSQIANLIGERTDAENLLLFMVIPDYSNTGSTTDYRRQQAQSVIMVLEKTDYSSITHSQFLDIMQRTQLAARAIEDKMIADKDDYSDDGCQFMKTLNVGSIRMSPVWAYAGCNGWSIEFNFDSD